VSQRPGLLARMDHTGIPLLLARLVLGGLLVYMGVSKIGDPVHFLKLMRQYQALPASPPYFLNAVAVVLPWVETVCGLALILGAAVRGAGLIAAIMLVSFTPLILLRGLELYHQGGVSFCGVNFDCGCGAGPVFLCNKLAENVGLFVLALLALFSRSRRFCLGSRRLPAVSALPAAENEPVPD
jgi:uncharacterized membrane protein YphA (DoxX/SURF4 family)